MNENEILGGVQNGVGKAQSALGDGFDAPKLKMSGAENQIKGATRKVAGKVQDTIGQVADKVSEKVGQAGERAQSIYDRASDKTQELTARVEPMIKDRPFAAIGLTLAAGVVLGLLMSSRGPKVIYVKPNV